MQLNTENYQVLFDIKPRKGDLKKMEIVQAAIECIATIGFENTTYQAIADKIDTRRAHVAYHFSDKSDIFKACIIYINSNYQRILIEKIESASTGKEILAQYAESPFTWAQDYPNELSVMLLFYYLCTINEEYKSLNDQIRKSGIQRILLVLTQKCELKNDIQELEAFASRLQNLISGSIIDAVTTNKESLTQSKKKTRDYVLQIMTQMENQ